MWRLAKEAVFACLFETQHGLFVHRYAWAIGMHQDIEKRPERLSPERRTGGFAAYKS